MIGTWVLNNEFTYKRRKVVYDSRRVLVLSRVQRILKSLPQFGIRFYKRTVGCGAHVCILPIQRLSSNKFRRPNTHTPIAPPYRPETSTARAQTQSRREST